MASLLRDVFLQKPHLRAYGTSSVNRWPIEPPPTLTRQCRSPKPLSLWASPTAIPLPHLSSSNFFPLYAFSTYIRPLLVVNAEVPGDKLRHLERGSSLLSSCHNSVLSVEAS